MSAHPRSRPIVLLDSRVALGSFAKGRSSSPALTHVLRGALAYTLGGELYPGGLHIPSAMNRSDAPSRHCRDIPPPGRLPPPWLQDLARGDARRLDQAVAADGFVW